MLQKLNSNEVEESENALKTLKAEIRKVHKFNLPVCEDERIVLEIIKEAKILGNNTQGKWVLQRSLVIECDI